MKTTSPAPVLVQTVTTVTTADGETLNVSDTARRQLDKAAELADNTKKAKQSDHTKFIEYCGTIGNVPTAAALVEYLATLSASCKISTLRRKFANLSQIYTLTDEQRKQVNTMLRQLNHAQKVETNRARKGETNADGTVAANFATKQAPAINKGDLFRIIDGMDKTTAKGKRDAAMFAAAFFGGLRGSELTSLRIENITDTADGNVKFELLDTKTAENADVFIYNQYAKNMIREYIGIVRATRTNGELFTKIDKHGNITADPITRQSWHRIVKAHGDGLQTHSFRRGAITELIRAGAPIADGMQFSRHADKASFMRYVDAATSEQTNGGRYL